MKNLKHIFAIKMMIMDENKVSLDAESGRFNIFSEAF